MGRLLKNNIKKNRGRPQIAHPYKDILTSRPWKNTEKTLKRCGVDFFEPHSGGSPKNATPVISYMDVMELYRLHYIADMMRQKGMPVELFKLPEVYQNKQTIKSDGRYLHKVVRWGGKDIFISSAIKYIIVPTHIRRAVSGLMGISNKKVMQCFNGGLYKHLFSVYSESWVEGLMKRIQTSNDNGFFTLPHHFHVPDIRYPVTTLFTLESERLFNLEPIIVFEDIKKINDVCFSESLATALFLSLLNVNIYDEINVSNFIKHQQKLKNKDERVKNARLFLDQISSKYHFLLK